MKLSIITLSKMTPSIMTPSITALSIMTIVLIKLRITLRFSVKRLHSVKE
jgi:hypothetical protein